MVSNSRGFGLTSQLVLDTRARGSTMCFSPFVEPRWFLFRFLGVGR